MNIVKLKTKKVIDIVTTNSFLWSFAQFFVFLYFSFSVLIIVLSFSQNLLYSSLIDLFADRQCFRSYLRVSILQNKKLLSTDFDNNVAREVLFSFFVGQDVITVTRIPKRYGMCIWKIYLLPGSFHIC